MAVIYMTTESDDFKQATLTFHGDTFREFKNFLTEKELESDVVDRPECLERYKHDAMFRLVLNTVENKPEEFINKLESLIDEEGLERKAHSEKYSRETLYFHTDTKRRFERFLKRQKIEFDIVYDSLQRQKYEAMLRVCLENAEKFFISLKEVLEEQRPDTEFEFEPHLLEVEEDEEENELSENERLIKEEVGED